MAKGNKSGSGSAGPKATAWEKLRSRKAADTLANRDVYRDQQVDRSKIETPETGTSRTVLSVIVGVIVFALTWSLLSMVMLAVSSFSSSFGGESNASSSEPQYYGYEEEGTLDSGFKPCWYHMNPEGLWTGECTTDEAAIVDNVPEWYPPAHAAWEAEHGEAAAAEKAAQEEAGEESSDLFSNPTGGFLSSLLSFSWLKLIVSLIVSLGAGGVLRTYLMRNLSAQNLMKDSADINQHEGDQHIMVPEEMHEFFDFFPNTGAHSNVMPSSLISHNMFSNKGLKKVEVARRHKADVLDENGDIEYYKGDLILGDDGNPIMESMPMIDEAFGQALFDASGLPKGKEGKAIRHVFDTTRIAYNPDGSDREKLGKFGTVADLINDDWIFPEYEVQRPSGAYIVDTAPVNTMVLAMTRAGKGQTYIEPMIDMWLRERRPNNMVINDPKGELLVKNYVPATMRGFQVVQFNLINSMKTDIYNPLGMAADAARENDPTKCALYVENIADVFFPVDGGDDPVWPNAANNAFKRAAYGLIDYYLEEERELRSFAAKTGMEQKVLETKLDSMWGKVTLYNCYQLFVQLSSRKMKNPGLAIEKKRENGEFEGQEDYDKAYDESGAALWEGLPEKDMLSLFFSATNELPTNTMRTLIMNADNALKAMGGSDKMLASVYGIAITAMSFFTDPTISTLTSGTPSQNTDLGGLSFPRRMGVRFSPNFLKRDSLMGAQAVWSAYADKMFTEDLGKDFYHEDVVGREGWARYYFEGKFPERVAYLKLELKNAQSQMLIRTFYFKFTKDYQTSLNGRYYVTDPITGEKIFRNGILVELREVKRKSTGEVVDYKPGHSTFPQMLLTDVTSSKPKKRKGRAQSVVSTMARYSEQPKAVFLVTPPHLMKYAKLILILIKQLVDLNFDKSYMTKSTQKPLYKTRFMLDELGNLQSEGTGIAGFETMLSIGLGQEQQFTLILQTLQQLRDVYGESVDKIVQGNTSNIVFLKSTDDSMLDTLQKMSGVRHVAYIDSKTVTRDNEKVVKMTSVEGKVSYNMSVKEEPVISYTDMSSLTERNSIVFRAGNSPIWNRNELILPMSWRLFANKITHPGHDYTLQTIPTLSSALEFDVRMNQPDFTKMLERRMTQAKKSTRAKKAYQEAYGLTDAEVSRLDPDVHADEVMGLIDSMNWEDAGGDMAEIVGADEDASETYDADYDSYDSSFSISDEEWEEDQVLLGEVQAAQAARAERDNKIFAGGRISRGMLVRADNGRAYATAGSGGSLDVELVDAYRDCRPHLERDFEWFTVGGDGSLRSRDGSQVYISPRDESSARRALQEASEEEGARVYSEGEFESLNGFEVHPEFYEFLAGLDNWNKLANGEFDRAVGNAMRAREELSLTS